MKDFDFLVLMKKYRNERRRLITSYFVDYPHKQRKLANPGGHGTLRTLVQGDPLYPSVLLSRLAGDAPARLFMLGDQDLLAQRKTVLFCSARCPGEAILSAYDQAAR